MIHKLEKRKQDLLKPFTFMKEVLTVSELTGAIKKNLETAFPFVSVKGEISNLKFQSSGHIYFDLKDLEAKLSCALFRLDAAKIKTMPKDGDLVVAKGEINVWGQKGGYQLIVRQLQLEGLGQLLLQFQELKQKLQNQGWFDPALKKKIPSFPKTIGVVTSPTGAVIQDIINVLSRRHPGFHLILNPVAVQGEGSKEQIAKAIYDFNKYKMADVLIVGRGGGSLEDLWAFNEEMVAKAIYESQIPIISAVGHETDFSIADFVADIRAPTPSAAAEIAAADKQKAKEALVSLQKRSTIYLSNTIREKKHKLQSILKRPEISLASHFLKDKYLRLDQLEDQLTQAIFYKIKEKKSIYSSVISRLKILSTKSLSAHRANLIAAEQKLLLLNPKVKIADSKMRLQSLSKALSTAILSKLYLVKNRYQTLKARENSDKAISKILITKKERLTLLVSHLKSIDPKNLLSQGYSIVFRQNSASVILSSKEVKPKDKLTILLHDGSILVEAKENTRDDAKQPTLF